MLTKKLTKLIIVLVLSNTILTGCGDMASSNKILGNAKISIQGTSSNKEKANKKLNKEYINAITPYFIALSKQWHEVGIKFSKGLDELNEEDKKELIGRLRYILICWNEIVDIEIEETPEIKEIKADLLKLKELKVKSVDCFIKGIQNNDKKEIERGTTYSNESLNGIREDIKALGKSMKN